MILALRNLIGLAGIEGANLTNIVLQQVAEEAAGIYFKIRPQDPLQPQTAASADVLPLTARADTVVLTLLQTVFLGNFSCSQKEGFINVRLTPQEAGDLKRNDGQDPRFGNPAYLTGDCSRLEINKDPCKEQRLMSAPRGYGAKRWRTKFCVGCTTLSA